MSEEVNYENLTDEEYENLLKPLLDGTEIFDTNSVKPYEPPQPTAEILKTFELFKEQIELIHKGKLPIWTEFFALVKQLDDEYFSSHGESTSLADELFSVYELDNNGTFYSDDNFMAEILKILSDNIHLLCFLCSLASNKSTPLDVLKKLENEERYSLMAADEQCPFWDETDKETSNIAELARRTILKI